MCCAEDVIGTQPEPAAKQAAVKSAEAIIVRPAISSLPRILCNTMVAGSSSHTQQQQAPPHTEATAVSQGGAGNKRNATSEHEQIRPRQRSRSHTPSAGEATPLAKVDAAARFDCPTGAAQHEAFVPASPKQDKKQSTFNVITSGEQPQFITKRQLMVRKAQPSPFANQLDPVDMGPFASLAPFCGLPSHAGHGEPFGKGSCSESDMGKASSRSFDSSNLTACDMPNFDCGAGASDIAQLGGWESGFDAQLLRPQPGMGAGASPHNQDGSLTAQSKAWDWCHMVDQGLELNSQSAPDMPELPLLVEMSPSLPIGWQQQALQASWQNQQREQQHPHHDLEHQQQQWHPYQALSQPVAVPTTCSIAAAPSMRCTESESCGGAGLDWWMLPHCSMDNMFQADAALPKGGYRL